MSANKPRVILWDIETGFNLVKAFSLYQFNGYIPYYALEQERYIICASWKELGKNKVHSVSQLDCPADFKDDPTNDYVVVEALHHMLKDVDVLIHHNGNKFDLKYFNTRAVFHGFDPLPPIRTWDTLMIAKKHFLFNSNRLNYLGQFLGVGEKIDTKPELWDDCLHGKKSAVKEMLRYNKQDVLLLERVYEKIAKFAPAPVNRNLFDGHGCPHCGSENLQSRGTYATAVNTYQRYFCNDCRGWSKARKADTRQPVEYKP